MKKFISAVLSPFILFSAGLFFLGCEQTKAPHHQQQPPSSSAQQH